MPGFGPVWEKDPFNFVFAKRWKGFACFGFMDWMHTNGSEQRSWNSMLPPGALA